MGWRTVIVNSHSKLTYRNNHLFFKSAMQDEMIHLSEIDVLLLETTDITITTMLLKRLVDEHVLVLFCDDKRLPIGKLLPFYGRHDSSLQLTKQLKWTEDSKTKVWTAIIEQKILNQSNYLKCLGYTEKAKSILKLAKELKPMDPSNREGHASRIYFTTLFGTDFTRKTENEINAGLNYGYTLLLSMFAREIVVTGCMTQFGIKHINQFNDFNLASDLMEPFRSIVDQIIFEHQDRTFPQMKRALFDIFSETYFYEKKNCYLTNIIRDYTKKVIKELNNDGKGVPEFRI